MQTVDEKPETIHLYVVREEEPKPSVFPIVLSVLSLVVLLVFCVLAPYQQPVTRLTIRVPAVPLAMRTFTATVTITPTGVKVYPSTTAHGILTITNGSIIGQNIPAGFIIQNVATDGPVYVPAGSANGYGWAQVHAHAVISGRDGNLPPRSINSVIGSSVYVRNLSAFSGGHDAYSVKYATAQDKQTAQMKARVYLMSITSGLHYPCTELTSVKQITWRCQFITYQLPDYMHITEIKIIGKSLLINVWFVVRTAHVWVK